MEEPDAAGRRGDRRARDPFLREPRCELMRACCRMLQGSVYYWWTPLRDTIFLLAAFTKSKGEGGGWPMGVRGFYADIGGCEDFDAFGLVSYLHPVKSGGGGGGEFVNNE